MQRNPARSPPRLLRKKRRLPDQRPSRNLRRLKSVPPTRPKLKNGEQPPKKQQHRQSIPAHHRLNRQNTVQPAQGKTEATAPRHTSFDAVDGPKFLQPPAPRYPRLAQRKGIEGQVLMELMIDAEGRLMSASIKKSGGNGFDEAALEAVRKAIFRPATHNGRPATCIVLLPIHFTLRNAS